ncbi:hypothetical protein [Calidifontibacter terrae]
MKPLARRATLTVAAASTIGAVVVATSPGASATTVWTLKYNASASTTIAKMGKTVTTTGTDTTYYTLDNNTLTSDLALAPVTTPALSLGSLPLAYATVAVEPTARATGYVDKNQLVHITQKVNFHITKLSGPAKVTNLVGSTCKTSTPVTMNLTGKMGGLFDPLKLSGSFTIPQFSGCGLLGAMNSVVSGQMSGPGNSVAITLTPRA